MGSLSRKVLVSLECGLSGRLKIILSKMDTLMQPFQKKAVELIKMDTLASFRTSIHPIDTELKVRERREYSTSWTLVWTWVNVTYASHHILIQRNSTRRKSEPKAFGNSFLKKNENNLRQTIGLAVTFFSSSKSSCTGLYAAAIQRFCEIQKYEKCRCKSGHN